MIPPAVPARSPLRATVLFLLGTAVFAIAYCQAPLYYSNQNQYFLHGMASAGQGLVHEDWLANTLDPTPIFSALVALTARILPTWVFHIYYALLLGAFAAAMLGLFTWLVGADMAARRWPLFVTLLVLVHAGLLRWCSFQWLRRDYPWYFQAGVAGQYLLGAMFQPSTFGVLLVLAAVLFVRGRLVLAAICTALAPTIHSTYLVPAALLTLGFLAALVTERRFRQALALAAGTFALVLPVVVYVVVTFGPTSAAQFAEAQDLLVNFRIPHHARPRLWLDGIALLQVAWVALAVVIVRRTRLFAVLAVPFVLAIILTMVEWFLTSNTLALLFPWRISTVLIPLATTVILSRLVSIPAMPLDGRLARAVAVFVVVGLVAGGIWISVCRMAFHMGDEDQPLMDFVRQTRVTGDVYFLPVRVPNLAATTRGAESSDFKERRNDVTIIPVDLQRFRLVAGAPIFVDFKAIPYKDTEVLTWRDRLREAESLQESLRAGRTALALLELRRLGVTHVVLPASQKLLDAEYKMIYADDYYQLFRLSRRD